MLAVIDAIGLFAFGLSGALLAVRRGFDVVGIVVLAVITAIGGGVLRDLLLGDTPPAALTEWRYLAAPLAAAAVVFGFHPAVERLRRGVLLADAAGLGLFCVVGTEKALRFGLGPLSAAALGVITAVGGGLLRDVVARETPVLVDPQGELYAIPAAIGAGAVALAWALDVYEPAVGLGIAAVVVAVRLAALARGWRAPVAPTL